MTDNVDSLLTRFFEMAETPLALVDRRGVFVRMNRAWTAAPIEAAAAVGDSFVDLLVPEDVERVRAFFARLSASGRFDATLLARTGGSANRLMRFHATLDPASGLIQLVGVDGFQSLMEAHKDALLNGVLLGGPVMAWSLDAEGRYTSREGGATASLDVAGGEVIGESALELHAGTDAHAPIARALAGEAFHGPIEIGRQHWDLWLLPIRDANGQPDGVVAFSVDQTAARDTEARLRQKMGTIDRQQILLQTFSHVVDTAPVVLWSTDRDGVLTIHEGKGLRLLGFEPGKAVGQNIFELFKDFPPVLDAVVRGFGGEQSRMVDSFPGDVHFDSWILPMKAEEGSIHGVVGLAIDASERIRKERELADKLDLIQRQSATIRALATPIIQVWDEVLCLPVIGTVDSARTADMMQSLLESIVQEEARYAIVDLTGVEVVDTATADHLIKLFRAAKVLGVEGVLCGIRPAVAQTVVAIGLDLDSVRMMRSLRDALMWCIREKAAASRPRTSRRADRAAAVSEG